MFERGIIRDQSWIFRGYSKARVVGVNCKKNIFSIKLQRHRLDTNEDALHVLYNIVLFTRWELLPLRRVDYSPDGNVVMILQQKSSAESIAMVLFYTCVRRMKLEKL